VLQKGVAMKEYKQSSLEEKKELFVMKIKGIRVNEIANALGRHYATN